MRTVPSPVPVKRYAAAAVTLLAVTALSACGDGDKPMEPKATFTPTGHAESPPTHTATPAGPVEPILPPDAAKESRAGARSFVTYFWALVDYATATGDVETLEALAGPMCSGCHGGSKSITRIYKKGGSIESGPYVPTSIRLTAFQAGNGHNAYIATVQIENSGQVIHLPSKADRAVDAANETYTFALVFANDSWRVDTLGVD